MLFGATDPGGAQSERMDNAVCRCGDYYGEPGRAVSRLDEACLQAARQAVSRIKFTGSYREIEKMSPKPTPEVSSCRDLQVNRIISNDRKRFRQRRKSPKTNRVIHGDTVPRNGRKVRVVGGDSGEMRETGMPPSIQVDKLEDGRISRIIVKCQCGRHAELLCSYE